MPRFIEGIERCSVEAYAFLEVFMWVSCDSCYVLRKIDFMAYFCAVCDIFVVDTTLATE